MVCTEPPDDVLLTGHRDRIRVCVPLTSDADSHGRCVLLQDQQVNAATVTRAWFASTYTSNPLGLVVGNRDFETFAPNGGLHLDPAIVQQDFDTLQSLTNPLKKYVDKRIAHHNAKVRGVTATYGELDTALEELRRLLKRYFLLLKQGALLCADAVNQMPWTDIFAMPWKIG